MSTRTSAEVINATLLEVFLIFVFVVLSIAWFERRRADAEGHRADSTGAQADSMKRAQFDSPFPPICHVAARPRDFVEVTLAAPGRLDVRINRQELRHGSGQTYSLSFQAFADTFADIAGFSQDSLCRFRARVRDTQGLPKDQFKKSLAVVRNIFYTHGEFQ